MNSFSSVSKKRIRWGISSGFVVMAALVAMLLMVLPVAAHSGPELTPASVEVTLKPGESVDIEKTVHTPEIAPLADICFLADTTGSMGGAINNVKANAQNIIDAVQAESPDAQFCVAEYKDFTDAFAYKLNQTVTGDELLVQAGINAWVASGGGDFPEAQLNALSEMADPSVVTNDPAFRPGSTRVIVWFGDAPGHDPSGGHTLASTIADLTTDGSNAPIIVIALSVGANQLNSSGQAQAIADATGGIFRSGVNEAEVADAIIDALQAIDVEVAMVSDCAAPISTTFNPASQTVQSGDHAVFTETITAAADAEQGKTYTCNDWATINGEPMTDASGAVIMETKTIHIADVTPPAVACTPTHNPSGKHIPNAGNNPKSGQNPDGFYRISAKDNVDASPQVFVVDMGTGTVFGPYPSDTDIKYTQAPGVTPSASPMAGEVEYHIKGKGDAGVYAVDASGNKSTVVSCKVPPPPK